VANKGNESDALFQLPLADFTAARNALASRLKQAGHPDEAARVKALAKPSISAWAVNQLYWTDRASFDRLLEAGARLRGANMADLRGPLEARREAISKLLRAAETLLGNAGHSPAPETLRRIESTLEAVSAMPEAQPGRLTADITPPGFEALASLFPGGTPVKPAAAPRPRTEKSAPLREAEQARDAAQKKFSKADAKRHEAEANVRLAEAHMNEARARFEKAAAAADEAREHARKAAAEAKAAADAVQVAELAVEKAR
jgi:hypothetical protein